MRMDRVLAANQKLSENECPVVGARIVGTTSSHKAPCSSYFLFFLTFVSPENDTKPSGVRVMDSGLGRTDHALSLPLSLPLSL